MAGLNGFIKLHRKMIEWGWYSDSVVKDVFIHLLMVAAFKPGEYMGHSIAPGQAVIGRKKMAIELGFSEQQIRTALKKLESTGEIKIFSTNRFSIVTVENWGFYQGDDEECNQQITNNQPTDNQQITNNQPHLKNVKNVKNVKNERVKRAHGEFKNVFLTDKQFEDFSTTYQNYKDMIENLSNWKERKGIDSKGSDIAMLKYFAKEDGIKRPKEKDRYAACLAEAQIGCPPASKEGLTDEQYEELVKIADAAWEKERQ